MLYFQDRLTAIMKIKTLQYLGNFLANFDEILHDDAY